MNSLGNPFGGGSPTPPSSPGPGANPFGEPTSSNSQAYRFDSNPFSGHAQLMTNQFLPTTPPSEESSHDQVSRNGPPNQSSVVVDEDRSFEPISRGRSGSRNTNGKGRDSSLRKSSNASRHQISSLSRKSKKDPEEVGFSLADALMKQAKSLYKSSLYSDIKIRISQAATPNGDMPTQHSKKLPHQSPYIPSHKFLLAAHGFKKHDNLIDFSSVNNPTVAEHLVSWLYTQAFNLEIFFTHDRPNYDNWRAALSLSSELSFVEPYRKLVEEHILQIISATNYQEFLQLSFNIDNKLLFRACLDQIESTKVWQHISRDETGEYTPELMVNLAATFYQLYPPVQRLVTLDRLDALTLWFDNPPQVPRLHEIKAGGYSTSVHPPSIQLALDASQLEIAALLARHQPLDQSLQLIERYIVRENFQALKFLLEHTSLAPQASHVHLFAEKCFKSPEILGLFIEHAGGRASFAWSVMNHETALHVAIRSRNSCAIDQMLSYLDGNLASLGIKDKEGKTPLYRMFEKVLDYDAVKSLVNQLQPDPTTLKPLFAEFVSNAASIELLMRFIEPQLDDLNFAIEQNHVKTVALILSNSDLKPDETSFELIAKNGLREVLANIPDDQIVKSQAAFLSAIEAGQYPETTDLLLSRGVCELQDSTIYETLIANENLEALLYLISKGKSLKLETDDLEVLLSCVRMGNEEILSKLLCDSNARLTELHHSAAMWQALRLSDDQDSSNSESNDSGAARKTSKGEDLAALLHSSYSACVDAELDGHLLIQRAIAEKRENAACFLIESNCVIYEIDRDPPLSAIHQAAELSLDRVIQSLLVRPDLKINSIFDGETALHIAINNLDLHSAMILLSYPDIDVSVATEIAQETPLQLCARLVTENSRSTARIQKIHTIADRIVSFGEDRADPYDRLGRSVLHKTLQDASNQYQLEHLQFYLQYLNPNKITQDGMRATPLHIATSLVNENAVKILLGSDNVDINSQNSSGQTPLHVAAKSSSTGEILKLYIEEKRKAYQVQDSKGMNVWAYAVYNCNLTACMLLARSMNPDECLKLSLIKAIKQRNVAHLLCKFSTQNQDDATLILDMLLELDYDKTNSLFNDPDEDGNTPLMLAYSQGNASLCENLVSMRNVCLAHENLEGDSIFTFQCVANDRLLRRILTAVVQEPPWNAVNESKCSVCKEEFGIFKKKRHHCRHCGRAVCQSCCHPLQKIIDKFAHDKTPKRLCEMCYLLV